MATFAAAPMLPALKTQPHGARSLRRRAVAAAPLRAPLAVGARLPKPGSVHCSPAAFAVGTKGVASASRRAVVARATADAMAASEPKEPTAVAYSFKENCLPKADKLDKLIMAIWLPAVLNFLLIPLVAAGDVFWVGRLGDSVSLAAQGSADRVFSSVFWTISFLPSLVTPLVAKAAASGDKEGMQKQIGEAIFVAMVVGGLGMAMVCCLPNVVLSVVGVLPSSPVYDLAKPYVVIRGLTFIPAIVATVGFAAFRGTMDVTTPLKITAFTQAVNMLLDPFFIFGLGAIKGFGVTGAAMARACSEVVSMTTYSTLLIKRGLASLKNFVRVPDMASFIPLLTGGLAVQLRSLALNLGLLAVSRATMTMDSSGTMAAAHSITVNLWQLVGVILLALSNAATILIPQRLNSAEAEGGLLGAKRCGDRLLVWGLVGGVTLGLVQFMCVPLLQVFSPVKAVQDAARLPAIMAAAQQALNGVAFVAEGMMQGHQAFGRLAVNTILAALGLVCALEEGLGSSLMGVWASFWIFNGIRCVLALHHHFISGPLAPAALRKKGIIL